MGYTKTGVINDISEIPLNKALTISGNVNRHSWHWRMDGVFERKEGEIVFRNIDGIVTKAKRGEVHLNVLKKTAKSGQQPSQV